jgi:hypothetical protein
MCGHCGCGNPWGQPVIPAPLAGMTSYTASYAGALARPIPEKLADVFHAADFGFSPSNTAAGNLTAWSTMMTALAARGGGTVHLGPGRYNVSGTLTISVSDVAFVGEDGGGLPGAGGTYIRCTNPAVDVMAILNVSRVKIFELKLGYSGAGDINHYALRITNSQFIVLKGLVVWPEAGTTIGNGVLLTTTNGAAQNTWNVWMRDCSFVNTLRDGVMVFGFSSTFWAGGPDIDRCFFSTNARYGVVALDWTEGMYIRGATDFFGNLTAVRLEASAPNQGLHNIIISGGAVLDGSINENLWMNNAERVMVMGCWISFTTSANAVYGVRIGIGSTEISLIGNIIQFHNTGGIRCAGQQVNIQSNTIEKNPQTGGGIGVWLEASAVARVIGNAGYSDSTPIQNDSGANSFIGPNLLQGNLIYLGDLRYSSAMLAGNPVTTMDTNDFTQYDRAANLYQWMINNITQASVGGGGAGDTSLTLLDITSAALRRVRIDNADLGSGVKRYLYLT